MLHLKIPRCLQVDRSLYRIETPSEVLSLGALFFPFFIELVLRNTLGTVNTITLSHYSENAVAAVGTASQLTGMILTFYTVVSTGASIVISQYLGAERRQDAAKTAQVSLEMSFFLSISLGAVLVIFARPALELMQIQGTVLDEAVSYFRIFMAFSFLQALFAAYDAILRSYGLPKVSVAISLLMNAINMLLNIVVVYRPFETPLHGVIGVAVSLVISEAVALIVMAVCFYRMPLGIGLSLKSLREIVPATKRILGVGLPGGILSFSYTISQVVSTSIIAVLGVATISAKIYVSNIFFYVYVLGFALGQATSLMVSRYVGAREFEKAYRLSMQNLRITVVINIMISVLILIFGLYTKFYALPIVTLEKEHDS